MYMHVPVSPTGVITIMPQLRIVAKNDRNGLMVRNVANGLPYLLDGSATAVSYTVL
jgi:hypothetical protein